MVRAQRCEVGPSSPGTRMGSNSLWRRQIGSGLYSYVTGHIHANIMDFCPFVCSPVLSNVFRFFSFILDNPTKTRWFHLPPCCLSLLNKRMAYQWVFHNWYQIWFQQMQSYRLSLLIKNHYLIIAMCLCARSLRRVAKSPKWEQRLRLEKCPARPQ